MAKPFPHKLQVHQSHVMAYQHKKLVEEVFTEFKQNSMSLAEISAKSGIHYGTIQYWHSKFEKDKNYFPGQNIGLHKRIFSPQQEKSISEMIKEQFIDHHVIIHRKQLKKLLYSFLR